MCMCNLVLSWAGHLNGEQTMGREYGKKVMKGDKGSSGSSSRVPIRKAGSEKINDDVTLHQICCNDEDCILMMT